MTAREDCCACQGAGVIRVKCCGPRLTYDCFCGYDGGYDIEVCPDCEAASEQEEAATGSHPAAA